MTRARLVLEDGTEFAGKGFGELKETGGEVVFNTSMVGYQEILTDPSYSGQIVTMTYPLIGNYGINPDDFESHRPFARGLIVRELCHEPSNWRSRQTLDSFLKEYGLMGLAEIDTRALTRRLRSWGTMKGMLTVSEAPLDLLVDKVKNIPDLSGQNFVERATSEKISVLSGNGPRVAVLDFGAKRNITNYLNKLGCEVVVFPAHSSVEEILSKSPKGIVLSNGPGDPKDVPYAVQTVSALLGKIPIFGICLGHQLLGLALGGDTYKLKFGHRGGNHPVKDITTGKVYITSQNHGFCIREDSLNPDEVIISHRNVNDETVEGIQHRSLPAFSVQYHPEATPGPMDSEYLFHDFLKLLA